MDDENIIVLPPGIVGEVMLIDGNNNYAVNNIASTNITIYGPNNQVAVVVKYDGQVEFGEGYTPSKAAKTFWQAVRWYAPEREQGEQNGTT